MTPYHRRIRAACRVYAKMGYLLHSVIRDSALRLKFIKQYNQPVVETIGKISISDKYIFKMWENYKEASK